MAQTTNINIIGLGTQDSLAEAQEFVDAFGTTSFPMIWDPSFASWLEMGVNGQPFWALFDAEGNQIAAQGGELDEALIRSYSS